MRNFRVVLVNGESVSVQADWFEVAGSLLFYKTEPVQTTRFGLPKQEDEHDLVAAFSAGAWVHVLPYA